MDNVAGASVPITLGGVEYRMSPLSDCDLAELDLWLRGQVIATARASLPPDADDTVKQMTMRAAFDYAGRISVTSAEGARMMATLDGIARYVWHGIRRNHPGVTVPDLRQALLTPDGTPDDQVIDRVMDNFSLANGLQDSEKKARGRRRGVRRRKRRLAGQRSTDN